MKKLLLHSCCAPCSTQVIDVLKNDFELTIFYSNSNIYPEAEYQKRLSEQEKYVKIVGVDILEDTYDEDDFLKFVKGLESEKEGGARCVKCFEYRLRRTAKEAKKRGFDYFGTTLTVSPHKNSMIINQIGNKIAEDEGIAFLEGNYKKQDGYKKSIEFSKKYNLYRQNYCGCRFSIRKED